jgi:hypothetical protein
MGQFRDGGSGGHKFQGVATRRKDGGSLDHSRRFCVAPAHGVPFPFAVEFVARA